MPIVAEARTWRAGSMGAKRTIYIGTERGPLVLQEQNGGWIRKRTALQGKAVNRLLACGETRTVFATVAGEGLYASWNGGATWGLVLTADVRSLAADPSNPNTVYAGTEPVHLFRSEDAGDSWIELEGLRRLPEQIQDRWWFPQYPHEGHVLSVCVDPHNSQVIYVGLEHGGIYRTDDGGAHWEDLSAGIEYLDIHAVAVDPARENVCYASTARGFYRSEDCGQNWIVSESGLTRDYFHDMVVRSGSTSTLYLTTANGIPPTWLRPARAQAAIFRSDDSGMSWRQLTGGLPESLESMPWAIVGDPLDDTSLYAGLGDYPAALPVGQIAAGEVWTSGDRGDTWSRIWKTPAPVRALAVGSG